MSISYTDIKRYLQTINKLSAANPKYLYAKDIVIIPHNADSLFDEIPVDKEILENENAKYLYGVSHKDGNLYVQSLGNLRKMEKTEQSDNNFLFPMNKFVLLENILSNPYKNKFIHTHCHLEYSSADGMAKAEDMARRCKQLGFSACAITDHGTMAGIIEFYKACKKFGIKPILGQEFYFDDDRFAKGPPEEFVKSIKKGGNKKEITKIYNKEHRILLKRHIVLLAKNEIGLKNLYKLSSLAYQDGFHSRPRIDWDLLTKYHEGIIATTACAAGILSAEENENDMLNNLRNLLKLFGKDDLYLEVMLINYQPQAGLNDRIFALAKKYSLKTVCTVDSHYIDPDVDHLHHLYMKIGVGYTYGEGDNFLKTYCELQDTYQKFFAQSKSTWEDYDKAIAGTFDIADKCSVELELGKFKLPKLDLTTAQDYQEGDTEVSYLKRRVLNGWKNKIVPKLSSDKYQEYKNRLVYELKTLVDAGYVGYTLICLDIIDEAKRRSIFYNVRGSAAGSLVYYVLDITSVDPVKRGAMFERFVSPLRAGLEDIKYQSFPDVDFDFGDRQQMIQYLEDKYGKQSVARIATHNRMQIRQALKEIATITNFMSKDAANNLTKKLNNKITTLEQALEIEDFKNWYNVARNKEWFNRYVNPVIDLIGYGGIHASGVVIAPGQLTDFMPMKLQERKKESEDDQDEEEFRLPITQFDGDTVEAIGLLKIDILGLRTIKALVHTIDLIRKNKGISVDLNKINLDDPKWYKLISEGDTTAIFQFDTETSSNLVRQVAPENYFELMVACALVRPGTAGPGLDKEYCERKKGKYFTYDHPLLEVPLKETYSIPLFQEQIFKVCNLVGGLSLVEADQIRKIMKKKDFSAMKSYQEKFIKGAMINGCQDREDALSIWKKIESWSGYGFNIAHSASYVQVALWQTVLKMLCPLEFYVGILQYPKNKKYLKVIYKDLVKHNIEMVMPNVNYSGQDFHIKNNNIIWSLSGSKYVGKEVAKDIGLNAPYKGIADLVERVPSANKRAIDALISIGAFSDFGSNSDAAKEYYEVCRKTTLPAEFDVKDDLYWEKKFIYYMGFSTKSFEELYGDKIAKYGRLDTYQDFVDARIRADLKMGGIITFFKKIQSKRGPMAIVKMECDLESVTVVLWSSFFDGNPLSNMSEDELEGRPVFVFGERSTDPQGKDQIQVGDPHQQVFELI